MTKKVHPKYNLKGGDTLQEITELFGIEESVWKGYHNNMCRLDDVIRDTLPKHLKEIFLLPELWEKEQELNEQITKDRCSSDPQKITFGYNNTLVIKFCPDNLTYKVLIKINSNNQNNTIEYYVSVRWVRKDDLLYTIKINKFTETYKINGLNPDLVADELAIQTASILYPLELLVTRQDGIIGVNNIDEIQKRWINIKKNILNYNEGEVIEKYLRLTEKSVKDEETLQLSLKNDWFLHTYFNNIYQTYTSEYIIDNLIAVPFVFNTDGVEYKVQQKIDKDLDENGYINISMKGEPSDLRSIIDLENKLDYNRYTSESPLVGECSAMYIVEPEYNTIEEVKFYSRLELEHSKEIDIHIVKIKK
jgi:hypothetical protein